MRLPKISLIIPCFNVSAKQLRIAFTSITQQRFKDYEVIVIDDGSDEIHHRILADACKQIPGVVFITQSNSGVSAARNAGIRKARGKYIAFMDADDALIDSYLDRAYQLIEKNHADFIIGGVKVTKALDDTTMFKHAPKGITYLYTKDDFEELKAHLIGIDYTYRFEEGFINRGPVARLVKREIAREVMFNPTLTIGEDLVWNLSVIDACNKVSVVFEPWYLYWKNPNSATHGYNANIIKAVESLQNQIAKCVDDRSIPIYLGIRCRICEDINLIWNLYLKSLKAKDSVLYKRIELEIYSRQPWNLIAEKKFFLHAPLKRKIYIIAYKLRCLFPLLCLRERIMRAWKNN